MPKGITSTEGLIRKIFKITCTADETLFYRGHSKESYLLAPSLFRKQDLIDSEHLMFRELLVLNPSDFANDVSTFEKLVRMQHYSLPTRLLDLTTNPLIALYFACNENHHDTAELIVFKIKNDEMKFFDSDTVGCLSNLARLQKQDKDQIDFTLAMPEFNKTLPITKLLHFIREEKTFFIDKIVPSDLQKIICVKGKMNNTRITSQSGAFLIYGIGAELTATHPTIVIERVSINKLDKPKILKELDALNINESTVFPYIENSAKYISKKYGA
jgi:hypothetical protein